MAAGVGSRYGGDKQIDGVGPAGEPLFEFAVFDAQRAGFGRVVFIIREELRGAFMEATSHFPAGLDVAFVAQRRDDLPAWFTPGERTKPWGTAQAVLAARRLVHTPFVVVNADDFYGMDAYALAADACEGASRTGEYAIVGMRIDATLSEHGAVVRGVTSVKDGLLLWLDEVRGIERTNGRLTGLFGSETRALSGQEIASMNCWVFTPTIFGDLADVFDAFLRKSGRDPKAEFTLPEAVNLLVQDGRARVRVIEAPGPWFGMTYKEDRAKVIEGLQRMTEAGTYPTPLFTGPR
jgi:NDP-sugar pyrophosphorylase family protein